MYYLIFMLFNIIQIEYGIFLLSSVILLLLFFFNTQNKIFNSSYTLFILKNLRTYKFADNFYYINSTLESVNYKVTDLSIYQTNSERLLHYFIRKNRVFNKGRYSRNRQTCKMAFYLALSIHSIAITGLFMWYYNLLIKFTYMWYVFIVWISLGVLAGMVRFRLYTFNLFISNLKNFSLWFFYIIYYLGNWFLPKLYLPKLYLYIYKY